MTRWSHTLIWRAEHDLLTFRSCSPATHGTHMANTYDFYKPKLESEYPEVDGPLSITAYVSAIDAAYTAYRRKHAKAKKAAGLNGDATTSLAAFSLDDVDYPVFHSPYGKMVQKAHARLVRVSLVGASITWLTSLSGLE